MTFRQKFFLSQDWFRNGVGLGLELVFGIGLVFVKPLLCYVLICHSEASEITSYHVYDEYMSSVLKK
jgi:hypothetical protein